MNKPHNFTFAFITNTFCSLKCTHCFQTEEQFRDRTIMSKDDIIQGFKNIEEVVSLNPDLDHYNVSFIGGETFLLDFEFWDWLLPYALENVARISEITGVVGSVNIVTNLFFRDHRYYDLLKKYVNHPLLVLSTSWEPDTTRFGKDDMLFDEWVRRVKEIGVKEVSIAMTKGVINYDPQKMYDLLTKEIGFTSYAFEMFCLVGKGSQHINLELEFEQVSKFLNSFEKVRESHVNVSPTSERVESIYKGMSLVFDGAERVYYSFLPNGDTYYFAYSIHGEKGPNIHEEKWLAKAVWGGIHNIENGLSAPYKECMDCEYLRYCRGGNRTYKMLEKPEVIDRVTVNECAGNISTWKEIDKSISKNPANIERMLKNYISKHPTCFYEDTKLDKVDESTILYLNGTQYADEAYSLSKRKESVHLSDPIRAGRTLYQRAIYWEELGIKQITIDVDSFSNCSSSIELLRTAITLNLNRTYLNKSHLESIKGKFNDNRFMKKLIRLSNVIGSSMTPSPELDTEGTNKISTKYSENAEIVYWLIEEERWKVLFEESVKVTQEDYSYINIAKNILRTLGMKEAKRQAQRT